jgi:AcrR family transcriptional regulator
MVAHSLQEGRRQYTAREIARVAIRLFAERGFDAVTVDEVAAQVGISARTFFRYFASKEDVVLQFQRRLKERLVDAFDARPPGEGAVTALRNAYMATSTVASEDREELLLLGQFLEESSQLLARSRGEQAVPDSALVAAVSSRLGIDPKRDPVGETIAAAMGAAASAAFHRWVASRGRDDPSVRVGAALDVLMAGLSVYDKPQTAYRRRTRKPATASRSLPGSRNPMLSSPECL